MPGLSQSRPVNQKGEHILYLHGLEFRGEKNGPGPSGEGFSSDLAYPSLPSAFGLTVLLDFGAAAVGTAVEICRIESAAVKRPDA
jgi:hypothetical protein